MGHSVTCNFQCTVRLSNGDNPIYGAMTIKDIKGIFLSEQDYQEPKGIRVNQINIFSQTKTGERYLKGHDYMIMDKYFKLHYAMIDTNL